MYLNRVTLIGFTGQEAKTFSSQTRSLAYQWPPTGGINKIPNGKKKFNGMIAWSTAALPSMQPI